MSFSLVSKVVACLQVQGPSTLFDLMSGTGFSVSRLLPLLDLLAADGVVDQSNGVFYLRGACHDDSGRISS